MAKLTEIQARQVAKNWASDADNVWLLKGALRAIGNDVEPAEIERSLLLICKRVLSTTDSLTVEQLEIDLRSELDRTIRRMSSALDELDATTSSWREVPINPAILAAKRAEISETPFNPSENVGDAELHARWRATLEADFLWACDGNIWIASALINRINLTGVSLDQLPRDIPSPKAGARADQAQMWGPLWLSGETAVFPSNDKDVRQRKRSRLIGQLGEPWNRVVSLFKSFVSNDAGSHE